MSTLVPPSLRVAMLARVVFPLHGFGGIERHVFHLVTHLARLGVRVTLYVQPALEGDEGRTTKAPRSKAAFVRPSSFVLRLCLVSKKSSTYATTTLRPTCDQTRSWAG